MKRTYYSPMKKSNYIFVALAMFTSLCFTSCDSMLDVDPERLTRTDDYTLDNNADSVHSIYGVLSQVQKLADAYVLLGELRGDLLDVSADADHYLNQINDFNIDSTNIYVNKRNYYSVINNCNYILQHLDTTMTDAGVKMKLRQYAAIKGIRAWTYMQLALNFKTVKYFTQPILTVADAEKTYPVLELNELADQLIADLEPVKDADLPNTGTIGEQSYKTSYSFFPIRFILGDLYLWKGAYASGNAAYEYNQKAANEYRDLMFKKGYSINGAKDASTGIPTPSSTISYWIPVNNAISNTATLYWPNVFNLSSSNNEVITSIACPTEYGQTFYLDSLNRKRQIFSSDIATNNWLSQTYYLNESSSRQMDLRILGSISYMVDATSSTFSNSTIFKYTVYKQMNKLYPMDVVVYRSALLYLRYAEAVNRMNKPNLAFAVLKYGLTALNMSKYVPLSEKENPLPNYMNFNDNKFANNVGIRMRGLGNTDKDPNYVIPQLPALTDSVVYVEDLIQKELALETAFEGNRFHDLMRLAIRRNDESYLADKVAAKHTSNKEAIRSKLMNRTNWYIGY